MNSQNVDCAPAMMLPGPGSAPAANEPLGKADADDVTMRRHSVYEAIAYEGEVS